MFLNYITIKLLVPGAYPLSKNEQVRFDESDLGRMAGVFNDLNPPRLAPVVIGHPSDDAPSYGLVSHLRVSGGSLIGFADNLNESFRRGMKDGLYPRYAAQFFGPDNPDNPAPGSWLLKHVGFMGPAPLSVRGFINTELEFMESLQGAGRKISPEMRFGGPGCVEFAQFGTAPIHPDDIALLARAHQSECAARGSEINIAQAVAAVMARSASGNANSL